MAFLNEESLAENVKTFPVLYGKSNDEFSVGKTSEKIHVQKLLNPLEERMVKCVYNKAANDTYSREVIRATAISEIAFASDMRSLNFKFESLNFKFCLTTYVNSYEQILYM